MKTPPFVHRRALRRNGPSARRLEPRMMFDGAAVVDATAAVNDSPTAEHTEAAAAPVPVVDTQTATSQATQPAQTPTETAPSEASTQTSTASGAAPTSDTGNTQPSGIQPGEAEGNSSTTVAPATGQQSATSSDTTIHQTAEPDASSQSETTRQEAVLANATDVASADAAHLSAVEEQAKQAIASFLGSADGLDKLAALFPGAQTTPSADWMARAEALRGQVLNGSFNLTVQFVDGAAMGNYFAAFTASGPNGTPTILVNHDWWNAQADDSTRVRALVEEYGHAIDNRLNPGSDTAGDEGEAFSDKVLNISVNYVDEARIAVENDHKSVVIDGISYEVETATLSFLTAYKVYTGAGFLAEKEQNRHHFIDTSLGVTVITDGQLSSYFSGNDVVAKVSINGSDYYGWVSRPIKDQGIVRGFYFWYDANFGNLSTATQDGNMDGDRNAADNNAFILVVDQSYFNNLSVAGSFTDNGVTKTYKFVGSSSDRVDSALNSLVVPNRAPTPTNDSLTILEDSGAGTGNVLTNDSDADGNALAVTGFSINGSAGTLGQAFTIANVGQFTLSADGSYSFTPAANYAGPVPTITYTVSDGQVSATATLSIAITPVNDAPGGTDKTITMDEDTSHTFSAGEFGFTDSSDNPANSLQSVVITTLPSAGTLTLNGTAVTAGQEILATDLTKLKFAPATDAFGATYATFTFQVRDSGGTANGGIDLDPTPNTITFKVNNVNDAPVAVADTNAINEDTATVTGNVSTNDSDPDGDTRTVVAASGVGATTGTGPFVVVGRYGTLTLQTNGTYSYALDNTNAAVQALRQSTDVLSESFSYTIADPGNLTASSTLTITIRGVNDTPVAVNDYNIAKESIAGSGNYTNTDTTGYKATGNVLSNDTDKDAYSETKTVTGIFSTALGSTPAAASTNTYITLTSAPSSNSITGSIVYYLDNSSNKVFLKDVSNNNLSVSIYDSSTLQVKLSGIVSTSIPSGATLHFTNNTNSNNDIATSVYGSSTTQQPSASVVLDNAGTVYVGMSVQGTGIPAGTLVGSVNTSTNTITLKDSSNNAVAVLLGSNTSLSFTAAAGTTITGRYGTLTIAANGGYTYTPTANNANLNEGQQATETFSYRMQDSAGSTADATLTITVLGSGTNDPHAVADVNTIAENSTNVTGNVVTGTGSPLTGIDTTPSNTGTLSVTAARSSSNSSETAVGSGTQITGLYGTLTISSTGAYTYALNNSNAAVDALRLSSDTLTDVFFYRVTNSTALREDVTTLTITITGANDAPVAVADTAIARESGGYANGTVGVNPSGSVLINDTDVDNGDTRAVNAVQAGGSLTGSASAVSAGTSSSTGTAVAGSYGSLKLGADGGYVYTVDNSNATVQALAFGQTLTDSFTYRMVDSNGASSTATLTVTIQGANDAPANAVPSSGITVAESSSVALSGISVADVDDASLTVQLTVQNGTLTVGNLNGALVSSGTNGGATLTLTGTKAQLNSALGTLSYQGATDYSGIDLLTVQTTDSAGLVALSTVDVTVTADSRTLTVTGSTVNETSPYLLFKVDGTTGQKVTLALQSTGTGSGDATIGADLSPNLEYFNGTAWTAYTGGAVTIPTGDVLLVRTAVYGDSLYEGGETVKLVASNKAGANYNGTGTIIDDGTGAIYLSTNTSFTADTTGIAQYPDDDRPLTVNSISVNEASPYAVFTVSGNANQVVRLSLTDGTATSPADYGTGLQYYNGTAWVTYTPGSDLTMTGSTLLVRTSIANDSSYEGQEAFLLGVTKLSSGTTVYGTASIYDDGTGSVYLATNTTGTANVGTDTGYPSALDDDRSVSVSSPTVNEGSDYAIFTLTGNSGQTVTLTLENVSASINTSQTLKVWDGLDWVDYTTTGALPTFDANGKILVRVDIRAEQDAVYEGAETFKLKATLTGQTAAAEGIATIKDDGTGSVYLSTNTTGTANTSTDTGYPSYLDDDRAVTVNSITVNEASPYAVFTVSGSTNQVVRLSLTDGTATSTADFGTGLEYYTGTTWATYTAGSDVTMAGSTLLVRTSIVNDSTSEGSETFKLVVTRASSGTTAEGTATIRDDAAGDVYLATNTTGTANVSTDTGYPSYLDDDRAVTVNSISVNEASPYAVFTVSGGANQVVRLSLTDGTATNTADFGTGLEYYTGTTWATYTAGSDVTMTGSTLLVRTSIVNDSTSEGSETFKLVVTRASSGTTAEGTATIKDDGTGSVYLSTNTTGTANTSTDTGYPSYLDDDRAVTVSSISVNEASPYAVFTVSGSTNQVVRLSLTDGTATSTADFGTGLEYYNGTAWVSYTAGSDVTMTGSTLLVRTSIVNDSTYEGSETFKLVVTRASSGTTAEGTATIKDDGTGSVYLSTNTTGTANASTDTGYPAQLDDDRAVTVNSISVNEASPYAVFTVSGSANQVVRLSLTDGTATSTADFGAGLEYYNGTAWTSYTAGSDVTMTSGTLLVRTSIVNDSTYEGSETFKLVVTRASSGTTAEGTATIRDDAAGDVYLSTNTTGTANTGTDTGYPSYLDDDRAVTVNSISVNEASPYAVFTVSGGANQVVRLSLTDGTATSTADFGTGLEYYNGTAWTSYTAGSDVTMTGSTLLVRTSIVNDSTYEGSETFKLVVTRASSGTTAEGTATIKDDGTGSVYLSTNTTGIANTGTDTGYPAQLDDDRPTIAHVGDGTANSITVPEGQSAVFTVTLSNASAAAETFVLGLAGVTATSGTDFGIAPTFSNGVTYDATAGTISVPAGVTSFTVTIPTVDDGDVEANETFTLTIGASTGTATITDNDVAPTPSTVVVTPPVTPTVPEPPTIPVTPVVTVTPVTPTVPEVVTTPVTPTLPEVAPTPVTPTVPQVVATPVTPAVPQTTPAPIVVTEVPAAATPVVQSAPAPTPVALSPVVTPQPSAGFAPLVDPAIVPAEIGSANALPSRPDDAVRQNPQYELRVDKPIPDVLIPTGTGSIAYILPVDAFKHTDPNARVEMSAALIDGKPLPSWLKFDPVKGAFTGTPPEGYRGDLQVKVVARDGVGRQAETMVHLKVGDVPQRQTQLLGKPSLAQQLKGHGLHAWKADRERLIHQARETSLASRMSKSGGRLA